MIKNNPAMTYIENIQWISYITSIIRMKLPNVLKPQMKTEFLNNNPLSNNSSIILFLLCLIKYVTYFIFVINELYGKLWQSEKKPL